MVRDEGVKINSKKAPFELVGSAGIEPAPKSICQLLLFLAGTIPPRFTLVGSAGIEPASMNKSNQTTLFMTGTIPPRFTLVGSAGIEPAIFAM